MPGFTTHYLFGVNAYKKLKTHTVKKIIFDHPAAYSLGQQGPDIFFYYLPSFALHRKNPGSVAHTTDTGNFLFHLIESRKLFPDKQEKAIVHAYIMGFVGHYLLDRNCHPYIYYRSHFKEKTPDYHGAHMNLEIDIDAELLAFYKNKLPSAFHQSTTIMLTRLELRTVASALCYAYSMTYPNLNVTCTDIRLAIRSMQAGTRFLHDAHGRKKFITRRIEALTLGYPILSPMMASDTLFFYRDPLNLLHRKWHNPWDPDSISSESFFDLFHETQAEYTKLLHALSQLFASKKYSETEQQCLQKLLQTLGNRSYHTGLLADSMA